MTTLFENPYIGPRTFSEEQADRFFGREREARDLLALVLSERLVLYYAQSGAGKSSLINTRLIPSLRDDEGFEVLPVGRVSGELPPGIKLAEVDNIFAFNLIVSLNQAETVESLETLRQHTQIRLADFLQGDDDSAAEMAFDEAEYSYETVPHVLVIDQFEEIITTNLSRWSERTDFFKQLSEVMTRHPNLWIVLTMREDFVTTLDPYLQLLPNRLRARFYMQRMGDRAALQAIQEPAQLGGRSFTSDAVQALVDNLRRIRASQTVAPSQAIAVASGTADKSAALPAKLSLGQFIEPVQLQVVCYQLWENLRNQPAETITVQDLQKSGDVDTALAEFYQQALDKTLKQANSTELILRNWFERQVITEAGTRGTVYQGEDKTAGLPNQAVILLADQFLLRAEIRAGGTWYELVHDRFVAPILQSNQVWREQRLQQQPLMQATQVWQEAGQSAEKLLSSSQIETAQSYIKKNPLDITEEEQKFLEQSIRQANLEKELIRQADRRRNVSIGIAMLVIAVLSGLTWWALIQRNEAISAQAEVAQQLKITQAELGFSQTFDPAQRVDHLATLFELQGLEPRSLFWGLNAAEQLALFEIEHEQLPLLISGLYPTLGDVNQSAYTDIILKAMVEALATAQSSATINPLKTELETWWEGRDLVRKGRYKVALDEYDKAILINPKNPATRYEKAAILIELSEYEAALSELNQMVDLAHQSTIAISSTSLVKVDFATTEQMIQAARRLIRLNPVLGQLLHNSSAAYPALAQASLLLTPTPTPISAPDGSQMMLVPAGSFEMGDNSGQSDERPIHKVKLDAFHMDRYEVTNGQYAQCVADGGCDAPAWADSSTRDSYYSDLEYNDYPVTGVSWHQAKSYCDWRGARLPTEAEWEKAARGTDGRIYPWGNMITCQVANYGGPAERGGCVGNTSVKDAYPSGVSPYGVYDMGGNVFEWVADWYENGYYAVSPEHNPLGPQEDRTLRVVRGGGWAIDGSSARAAARPRNQPDSQNRDLGLRCVVGAGEP